MAARLTRAHLAPLLLAAGCARAHAGDPPASIGDLTAEDLRSSVIALINLTTAPGVDGALFDYSDPRRDSELERSSLLFNGEFTLRDTVLDGFWSAGLSHGRVDESLDFETREGDPVRVNADRSALSLQAGAGLVLPLDQHLRLRGYLTASVTRLNNETRVSLQGEPDGAVTLPEIYRDWDVNAATLATTGEVIYDRWFGEGYRLELEGNYSVAWTDTISDERSEIDGDSWHDTLVLRARLSGATGRASRGRPWRWLAYGQYVNFVDQPTSALGFRYYSELGVGIINEWNIKPLDWFGVRNIGFKFGLIRGRDLEGFSVGLTFR